MKFNIFHHKSEYINGSAEVYLKIQRLKKANILKTKLDLKILRKVNIYRWDPSTEENPRIDTYEVDMDNCPSKVLDILNKIKNEIDPTLPIEDLVLMEFVVLVL